MRVRVWLTALVVLILDQVTKGLALSELKDGPVTVIPNIFSLRLAFNPGGAFGLLQHLPGFFLLATIVVVGVILVWARRVDDRRWLLPLGMVLGGGLGNLTDRLIRETDGKVVDFIDFHVWPVFNLADSAIVVGVLWLLLLGSTGTAVEEAD
ncbi:MAG: signal peptidase II [Actinomycetota bacterium]